MRQCECRLIPDVLNSRRWVRPSLDPHASPLREGDLDWLRLYVNLLNKRKVQELSPDLFKAWINLLLIARQHDEGFLPTATDIAFKLHVDDEVAEGWLLALIHHDLIDDTPEGLRPHDWDEYQFDSDSSTSRVHKYRLKKQAEKKRNVTETFPKRYSETLLKRSRTEQSRAVNSALPENRRRPSSEEKPFSGNCKADDDDKTKGRNFATELDELAALVLDSTSEHAERKLLHDVEGTLTAHGFGLRAYLDDISPRLKRLRETPGLGFFLSHARAFGGESQDKIKPTVKTNGRCCLGGKLQSGEYCGECAMGKDLKRAETGIAREKAEAEFLERKLAEYEAVKAAEKEA